MTTIAWYEDESGYPAVNGYVYGGPPSLPLTTNTGSLVDVFEGSVHAGFVGEPAIGVLEILTNWEAVGGSAAPVVFEDTYDFHTWNGVGWDVVATYTYIKITITDGTNGILTIRAKIDGVYADGELTLTVVDDPMDVYSDFSWGWAEASSVSGPFWTRLVQCVQDPAV